LKKCGHVFCRECILKFALKKDSKDGNCMKCDSKFSKKDLVDLKESGSAFASHSNVEAKVYKPSF
jgi:hypothetical protein